ncbi:MAG TPA: hypothetical protein DCP57_11420 [Gammaproteobacteria bacterium]|nr:hypothetical protein [Gammaproteobacteria bacterium]HBK16995.1 hypothetical protein [Gammaproteobacteria bacterium]
MVSSPCWGCYKRLMHRFIAWVIIGLCLFACQTNGPPVPSEPPPSLAPLLDADQALLSDPDLVSRLQELIPLEQQALAFMVDEPLRLGSIGSALISLYPMSLTGNLALSRFYTYVEAEETAQQYQDKLDAIRLAIRSQGDGSAEAPFPLLSSSDAQAWIMMDNETLSGSIFQTTEQVPLKLLVLSRRDDEHPLRSTYFDLSRLIGPIQRSEPRAVDGEFNPWDALRLFAEQRDPAAQASIGTYLAKQRTYDAAIGWLQMASRSDNLLAHTMLARIFWYQAESTKDRQSAASDAEPTVPRAPQPTEPPGDDGREGIEPGDRHQELMQLSIENHLQAIALGSTESMYTLARLYLESPEIAKLAPLSEQESIALLIRAGELGHPEAYLYLAYHSRQGRLLPQSDDLANLYYGKAAALKDPDAIISYARFLNGNDSLEPHAELIPWLEELADNENAEAMVVLGNLSAKGIGTRRSPRQAVRWYKRAVNQAQQSHHGNAAIINEVAWTLTVSDISALQRRRYALSIMDVLMTSNRMAQQRPEYMDTWATAYAANGDFQRAIELQRQAIAIATDQERQDVLDILKQHLKKFESGADITDQAP